MIASGPDMQSPEQRCRLPSFGLPHLYLPFFLTVATPTIASQSSIDNLSLTRKAVSSSDWPVIRNHDIDLCIGVILPTFSVR